MWHGFSIALSMTHLSVAIYCHVLAWCLQQHVRHGVSQIRLTLNLGVLPVIIWNSFAMASMTMSTWMSRWSAPICLASPLALFLVSEPLLTVPMYTVRKIRLARSCADPTSSSSLYCPTLHGTTQFQYWPCYKQPFVRFCMSCSQKLWLARSYANPTSSSSLC